MPKERCALRIEPAGQKIECDAAAVCAQHFRVAQTCERMVVSNEVKRFALCLQRDGRPHHAKIIADVQSTAGLNAGQNSHLLIVCYSERSRSCNAAPKPFGARPGSPFQFLIRTFPFCSTVREI